MGKKMRLGEEAWVEFVDTVEELTAEHGMSKGEVARCLGYKNYAGLAVILAGRNGPSKRRLNMIRDLARQVKSGEYTPIGDGRTRRAKEFLKQMEDKKAGAATPTKASPVDSPANRISAFEPVLNGRNDRPAGVLDALDDAQVQLSRIEAAIHDIERRLARAAEGAPRLVQPGLTQVIDKVRDLRALTQEILPFLSYS